MSAAEARYINIFGTKGTGKTLTLRRMYARVVQSGGRGTFIDTNRKCADLEQIPTRGVHGIARSVSGWYSLVRRALEERRPFNVIVQPGWDTDLSEIWRLAFEVGHLFLAVDEAEAHFGAFPHKNAQRLMARGRNQQVSMACAVRVPPELWKPMRGVADVTMSFQQVSTNYADTIAADCFQQRAGRQVSQLLLRLPRWKYLRFASATGVLSAGTIDPPSRMMEHGSGRITY